ncbi:MAG TPA: tetratricopeptide repeat protein [Bryobacteraceae bacterium]|nr:tetratricopeptide repeat protein [Bryobacteraceae bacterium]
MLRAIPLFALLALLPLHSAVPPKWIYLQSENFQLLTDGGENSGRKTLSHFEQVRSFFRQTLGPNLTPLPVRIIQISNEARYKALRPSEYAAAFFLSGADLDMIVMGPAAAGDMTVAVHEYVHVLVRHSGLKIPLWLNEGIAEVYSTITPVMGKVQVGSPPPDRMVHLSRRAWMPLSLLFGMTPESAEYGNRNHAGNFYAQSWALAHMAMLDNSMRARFADFLKAVSEDVESGAAFRQVYGLSPMELEDKLDRYLSMPTINVVRFEVQMGGKTVPPPARIAELFESELSLAHIDASQGKTESAIERCERMLASFPERPEPHEALAYIRMRSRESDKAVAHLAAALARGATSRSAVLYFLRMAPPGHQALPSAEAAAAALIDANPGDLEARLALARCKLAARQATQARVALAPVRNVPKRDAPEFFRLLAHAALGEGDTKEALSAAQRLRAELPAGQRGEADNLISMIENAAGRAPGQDQRAARQPRVHTAFPTSSTPSAGPASAPAPGADFEPDQGPPRIRRTEEPSPAAAPAPAPRWRTPDSLPSADGIFESLDCSGARAAMRVRSSGRLLQLWIDNPLDIEMKNGSGASMDFACGKQTASRHVIVQFEPMPQGRAGDGLVRSLLFP